MAMNKLNSKAKVEWQFLTGSSSLPPATDALTQRSLATLLISHRTLNVRPSPIHSVPT